MKLYWLRVPILLFLLDIHYVHASHLRQKAVALQDLGTWGHAARITQSKRITQLHKLSVIRQDQLAQESAKAKNSSGFETAVHQPKDDPTDKTIGEVVDAFDKIMRTDVGSSVSRNFYTIKVLFLPGLTFMVHSFIATVAALVISCIWFAIYFGCIYKNDYEEIEGGRWDKQLADVEPAADAHNDNLRIRPDVILVFHHPDFEYLDQLSKAPPADFDRILVPSQGTYHQNKGSDKERMGAPVTPRDRDYLERITKLQATAHESSQVTTVGSSFNCSSCCGSRESSQARCGAPKSQFKPPTHEGSIGPLHSGFTCSICGHLYDQEKDGGGEEFEELPDSWTCPAGPPTLHEARIALLKDLFHDLYDMGFGLKVFSSCDEDEIFLAIRLRKTESIRHYLYLQQYSLRIRREIIPKLGIGQPPNVVPPMLRYDGRTVEGLHQSGVLEREDETELYKTHSGGLLVSTRDRIRLVYGALSSLIDVDAAKHAGFLVDWYPVHNPDWIPKLKATWASTSLLWDLTFVQPVLSLQSYFGIRVAFIFAWNGLYCKAMLALLPLALLSEAIGLGLSLTHGNWYIRLMVLSFNIIITVWSRIVYNIWQMEEQYLSQTWNVDQQKEDFLVRPSFHGEWKPTVADTNKLEKQYPETKHRLREAFSGLVTLVFCGLTALTIVIWYDIFKGRLTIPSTLMLMAQIKTFEFAWNAITPVLTEFENHKYQASFYNSYLWKNFTFQAVNSYSAYFYIAIKLQNSEVGCPDGSCLAMLRRLLIVIQLILTCGNIGWLIFQSYLVRFTLYKEVWDYRRSHDGEDPPERPPAEMEAKMSEFRNREQIESMCQLMLSVGFIFLFGAIAPIMVPFSLLVFALNLRVQAQMLVTYMKRPIPRRQIGIGAWKDVLLVLMTLGIGFSGFLLVVYGDTFKGVPLITRIMGLIMYCILMAFVWKIVDYILPPTSKLAHDLAQQHHTVLDRIHRKVQEKEIQQNDEKEELKIERKKSYWDSPIARGRWQEIRPLAMISRRAHRATNLGINSPERLVSTGDINQPPNSSRPNTSRSKHGGTSSMGSYDSGDYDR